MISNKCFDSNDYFNSIFNYDDPNIIASIIVREMEIMQDTISAPKRVQIKTKLAPWFDTKLQSYNNYKEDIHRMAVINDDEES